MRWSIRHQILVPFASMLLIAVLSVSLLSAYSAASHAERQIEEQLRSVARTLLGTKFPLTENVLAHVHGLAGADFVLTDTDGRVIATSGIAGVEPPPAQQIADHPEQIRLGPVVMLGGEPVFHLALRANHRGGNGDDGVLHILYPERVLQETRRRAVLPPLVVGCVALVLCVGLATSVARRISQPLVSMRSQLARMAGGDFRPLATPAHNDEVRDVATSVNQLARELDELRRAIARAERLSILGKLSGGLAHHLRNDVTGALMALQMHRRHCDAADQESLDVAQRQLALIEEHLKRFLAAGQPEQPRRATFDAREIAEEIVALLAPMARHRGVALRCDVPPQPLTLHADREQLRQSLMNLTLNAFDAVADNGAVVIEVARDGRRVAWRVRDSGPGLPAELAQRFGEPFLTTKPEGVGLGLAVALQVAEAHGGRLAYRREGDETCFEISLPEGDVAVDDPAEIDHEAGATSAAS